jgi:hypothetical protein
VIALNRTLRWRPLDQGGLEHFEARQWPDHIRWRSAIVGGEVDYPHGYFYEVDLRLDWTFRSIMIQRTDGVMLSLSRDELGRWQDGHGDRPDLQGCIDIDLSGSPSTNTLPIRRARFDDDVPQHFTMAFIDIEQMEARPDEQIYTRLGPDRFRYQSGDGGFEATIEVDADGFVVRYPPIFERL